MYASFNARTIGLTLSAARTLELAADAGFDGEDLMVRDLLDAGDDPRALRARMDDLGLRGGAFPLPVHWRGHAAEFGVIAARGISQVAPLLAAIEAEASIPAAAKEMLALLGEEIEHLDGRLKELEAKLLTMHRANAISQLLATVPG